MSDVVDGRSWYWVVTVCPACGNHVRASTMLRAWAARPRAHFDDSEAIITKSGGPKRLENIRSPLWDRVKSLPRDERYAVARRVEQFFVSMERRLSDAAREARAAASKARYL